MGIYFIYLGAVVGSNGLINFSSTASLIKREILPEEESFTPNLSRNETVEDLLKIQKHFGTEFPYANVKQENLNKYLKGIRFAITKSK